LAQLATMLDFFESSQCDLVASTGSGAPRSPNRLFAASNHDTTSLNCAERRPSAADTSMTVAILQFLRI
jgi:hypothetical protein